MIYAVFLVLITSIILMVFGLILSNNNFNKLLAINTISNYAIVFLCLMSSFKGHESYVDIAIIYSLTSFIAFVCLQKIIKNKSV